MTLASYWTEQDRSFQEHEFYDYESQASGAIYWDDHDLGDLKVGCLSIEFADNLYVLEVLEIHQKRVWNWVFLSGQIAITAGSC